MSAKRSNERKLAKTALSSVDDKVSTTDRALSRRQLLTGVAALAATSVVPAREALAQSRSGRPYRIDIHHHYNTTWTPNKAIEGMDQAGIATAILSRPGIPVAEREKARKDARESNEHATQLAVTSDKVVHWVTLGKRTHGG